jgi:hypothetical protein
MPPAVLLVARHYITWATLATQPSYKSMKRTGSELGQAFDSINIKHVPATLRTVFTDQDHEDIVLTATEIEMYEARGGDKLRFIRKVRKIAVRWCSRRCVRRYGRKRNL